MRLIRAKLFDLGIRSIYTPFHLIVFLEYNYYDRDVISRGESNKNINFVERENYIFFFLTSL